MARKKPGAYAPLSAYYADDDKIMEVGEAAELLYVRMLAYCARTPKTEGFVTKAQVRSRLGIVATGAEDDAETRAERCADAGLLVREGEGYRIVSWLRWNLSAEEVERVRTQDRNRKTVPVTSAKSGNGSGKQSGSEGVKSAGIPVPYTDTDTEAKQGSSARKVATSRPADWAPKDDHLDIAREYGLDPAFELRAFKDHHDAKGSKFIDWNAAFRTWLNKSKTFRGGSSPAPAPSPAARKHIPAEVPDHIDPNDPIAYAQWAKEATQ